MYYQYDGLNTVSELTNRNGEIIERYRYDAFGNIVTGITAPYNKVGYTGQEYDDKSGLINMNARWYDPNAGRFMTQDTYMGTLTEPLTQNLYSYVLNNPVNMVDPTGNVPSWVGSSSHYESNFRPSSNIGDTVYSKRWTLKSYTSKSTGLKVTSTRDVGTGTYYYYSGSTYKKWVYDYVKKIMKVINKGVTESGSRWASAITKDTISGTDTFRKTSGYQKTVYKSAAQQAADNKEVIKDLGDPPPDMEPIYTVSTLNDQLLDADILIGFDSEGKGVRKTIIERTIEEVLGYKKKTVSESPNDLLMSPDNGILLASLGLNGLQIGEMYANKDSELDKIKEELDLVFVKQYLPNMGGDLIMSVYKGLKELSQIIGGTGEGFDTVLEYSERIQGVAENRNIQPELIAGIIYKETMTSTPLDYTDEGRLLLGILKPEYTELPFVGDKFYDASLGLGQIFIKTAQKAEEAGFIEKSNNRYELADKLRDPYLNIDYIGAVLQMKARQLGIGNEGNNLLNLTSEETKDLLKSYNGSYIYADKVLKYLPTMIKLFE